MKRSESAGIIILKLLPIGVYFLAELLDHYIMGASIIEAIVFALISGIFMGILFEGWGLIAFEIYLILYPQKNKLFCGIVVILICLACMWVNYHVSEFIFSFAGGWNLGKLCVLYLNAVYAVITFVLMLIPSPSQKTFIF
ncbi:MAG: hypothetical protein E7301_08255 [Butyrivibrio sp.]|nr:hypothetical protein [Butyrivibrio sp.]